MTLLETILINYILLNWFITIMLVILPKRIIYKVDFIFIIVCPPLIIAFIGELIKKIITKGKKRKNKNKGVDVNGDV